MSDKKLVGKRIQERRKACHMTQTQLAEKMGYSSRSGINRTESGINNVSTAKLKLFAKALGTSFEYLADASDDDQNHSKHSSLSEEIKNIKNEIC